MLESTLSTLKAADTGQRGFIITSELPCLEPHDAALARVQRELDQLAELVRGDSANEERCARLIARG